MGEHGRTAGPHGGATSDFLRHATVSHGGCAASHPTVVPVGSRARPGHLFLLVATSPTGVRQGLLVVWVALPCWVAMQSISSRIRWPSVCLLWENVLCPLQSGWFWGFLAIEFNEFLIYFENETFIDYTVYKYFLPFSLLSLNSTDCFLCCAEIFGWM